MQKFQSPLNAKTVVSRVIPTQDVDTQEVDFEEVIEQEQAPAPQARTAKTAPPPKSSIPEPNWEVGEAESEFDNDFEEGAGQNGAYASEAEEKEAYEQGRVMLSNLILSGYKIGMTTLSTESTKINEARVMGLVQRGMLDMQSVEITKQINAQNKKRIEDNLEFYNVLAQKPLQQVLRGSDVAISPSMQLIGIGLASVATTGYMAYTISQENKTLFAQLEANAEKRHEAQMEEIRRQTPKPKKPAKEEAQEVEAEEILD